MKPIREDGDIAQQVLVWIPNHIYSSEGILAEIGE